MATKKEKEYFACYIPVEKEAIKVGDKYINKIFKVTKPYLKKNPHYSLVGEYLVETRKARQNNDAAFSGRVDKHPWGYPGRVRVKLFLCTKKANMGDKVFCMDVFINNASYPPDKQINPWRKKGNADTCGACIKVVGEISPNATWVKDGDEFDKDEIGERMFRMEKGSMIWKPGIGGLSDPNVKKHKWFIGLMCPNCKNIH